MMKFGYCTGFELAAGKNTPRRNMNKMWEYIHGLGYDYIECSMGHLISIPDEEYDAHCARCHEIGLVVGGVNGFIPGTMRLCGLDKTSDEEIYAHVSNVFDRMSRIGVCTIVFGSGRARDIPEDISHEEGYGYLKTFLNTIAPLAQMKGITVVIEPLNSRESNVFTSVKEVYNMVRTINHPNIRMLVDSYHMSLENESPEIPAEYIPYIKHVHISEETSRGYPGSNGGAYVTRLLNSLRNGGYGGSVSVECIPVDMPEEIQLTMDYLREIGMK